MKIFCILLFIPFLFISLLKTFNIHLNYTASMPIGFYKEVIATKINDGDIVAVCLPNKIATIGLKNHYLAHGSCSNGSVAVLKKIIATPTDSVLLNNQFIIVDDIFYSAPRQQKDSRGNHVEKIIKNGRYSPAKTYWLYGANDPIRSWDSRYYGGVIRQDIIGVYKPLLCYEK